MWEADVTATEATIRSESDGQGPHSAGLRPVGMTGARRIRLVPIDSLSVGDSPRLAGEDVNHTRLLAGIQQKLPPIVVHSATMRVIDGMHRLSVARQRGDTMIEAEFFDGSESEAYVLAVRANIQHGLPLSFDDRLA